MNRVIGRYTGQERGPLLIVFGAMHGNEPAGVVALDLMFKMLEVEPITNPSFVYRGRILGLIGNLEAYQKKRRFIDRDLNRSWTAENVRRAMTNTKPSFSEEIDIRALIELVRAEIEDYQPERVVVLDLHTTSSYGGIFSIACDDAESTRIAIELHAPVIRGMLEGIKGTTLHYFNRENFQIDMVAVTFESGQHTEKLSVNRAIAALTNCMRTIGSVDAEYVENQHDAILIEYSKNLPKVARLVQRHEVHPEDQFQMHPNYQNFQPVRKGEVVASDRNGELRVEADGMILMPLYQEQGEDGFFLIEELSGY